MSDGGEYLWFAGFRMECYNYHQKGHYLRKFCGPRSGSRNFDGDGHARQLLASSLLRIEEINVLSENDESAAEKSEILCTVLGEAVSADLFSHMAAGLDRSFYVNPSWVPH